MGCNPCCCFSLKDSAVTIGIWTLVFGIAQLGIMGWQMAAIKYEKDRAANNQLPSANTYNGRYNFPTYYESYYQSPEERFYIVSFMGGRFSSFFLVKYCPSASPSTSSTLMKVFAFAQLGVMGWQMVAIKYEKDRAANVPLPNYYQYGKYDVPSYYESSWQTPVERYYTGLFVIQVLCLISAFFLLFASVALIYGIHTWSRYLVWPWFPCIVSSILCSLAYCIMWWAGDVRDYWLALTILEIIGVVINIYCVVVVLMYYRRIEAASDQYQNKVPKNSRVTYKVNRTGYPRYEDRDAHSEARYPGRKSPYPSSYKELPQYPRPSPYDATGMPQTPIPLPPNYTPYPLDPNEVVFAREPKRAASREAEDPVTRWVHSQQKDRNTEVNSEPISPSREVQPTQFPLQHSRSVPSMFDATLVSHRDCDHRRSAHHRSSSRHRHRSKGRYERDTSYSSDSETMAGHRRDGSRRRHKSRTRYSESEMTETTMEPRHEKKSRRRNEKDRGYDDRSRREDDGRGSRRRHHSRDRHRSDRDEPRVGRRDRDESDGRSSKRKQRNRKDKQDEEIKPQPEDQSNPMSGGFAIPWNVVIPPSSGERGPDGQPLPQRLHLNTEITINYDQNTSQTSSNQQRIENPSYRREKYQPMQITSNV